MAGKKIDMKNQTVGTDLTQGDLNKTFFHFITPFVLSNILQTFYFVVDMVIVGKFVGSKGLAGVSLSSDMMTLVAHVQMGFCSAAQILIGQFIGKKDWNSVGKMFGTATSFLFLLSVTMAMVGTIFNTQLLNLLNTPTEAFEQARWYLIICLWGSLFSCGYEVIASLLRAYGNSKIPFIFVTISSFVNLGMDIILVAGLHLESVGAAFATITSQLISFLLAIFYLKKKRNDIGFNILKEIFVPDMKILPIFLKLGFPLALQRGLSLGSTLYIRGCINVYGLAASTVTGIGSRLREFAHLITNAVSAAAGAIVSQCISAGEKNRVQSVIKVGLRVNCIYVGILGFLVCLFPETIFGFFTQDAEVLEMTHAFIGSMVLGYVGYAVVSPFKALLTGIGNSKLVTVCGTIESIGVRIILTTILGYKFGIYGYWYGNSAAIFVTAVIGGIYYFSGKWKDYLIPVNRN